MDKVDRLYDVYKIINDAKEKTEYEKEYLEMVEAAKGNSKEKALAGQFIPQFVKYFPNVSDSALEAQLDLAEDEDVRVRKRAVKDLPEFCKVSKNYVPKIADVLTQLLMSEDASEFTKVQDSLFKALKHDIKGTLQGILTQISTSEEEAVRKRAIEFLNSKLKELPEDLLTKEVEEFLLESSKNVISKVSGQDFLNLVQLLSNLKISKTVQVKNVIVDLIASQLDVNGEFSISPESINGFLVFMKNAYPFFSAYVSSHKFFAYICDKVFPLLNEIKSLDKGQDLVLKIFRVLADISPHVRDEERMKEYCEMIFNELLNNYVPDYPDDENCAEPELFFTHIECLLYTLAQFVKRDESFVTDNAERYKNFKKRLAYLNQKINESLKPLNVTKSAGVLDDEEKRKRMAKFTLENIRSLIRDFFRTPFSYRSNITLSWKTRAPGMKRHYEGSSSADNLARKERKETREIYVPPSGKYNSRVSYSGRRGRY